MVVRSCLSDIATDIYQEGIQFRTVKLLARGERVEEIYRMVAAKTRFPDLVLGDLASRAAGCLMGRDLVAQIVEDFGSARLRAAMLLRWDRSEQAVRTLIAGMPNGTYRAGSFLDDDRQAPGVPLPIEVAVIVADEAITVDLSSRPPQGRGPVNADCERGPGRWRGGLGVEKQCTILADCRIGTKVERARCRPWGVDGDQEGEVGRVVVCRDGAAPVTLLKGDVALQPGDRVEIYGGGRGYPARRDPEALRHDLAMAYVTQWPASAGEGSEA